VTVKEMGIGTYAAGEFGDAEHEIFHLGGCYILVTEEDNASL